MGLYINIADNHENSLDFVRPVVHHTTVSKPNLNTMQKSGLATCIFLLVLLVASDLALANYRKPPFNGSIFGKRTGSNADYDGAAKALSSMCEIAQEACAAWFPQPEASK